MVLTYPKTWDAYIVENQSNGSLPVDAYFYPGFVPNISADNSFYLRFQVVGDSYSDVVNQYTPQVNQGALKATAYLPPNVKGAS